MGALDPGYLMRWTELNGGYTDDLVDLRYPDVNPGSNLYTMYSVQVV